MAIMLSEVIIDSVDISATGTNRLLGWNLREDFGDEIRNARLILNKNVYIDIPTLSSGDTVTIKRGFTTATDQFVFNGTIDKIEKNGATTIIYVKDLMDNLVNSTVNYSYDGIGFPSTEAKGSDIATDLIETWGGMTAVVVDTGTVITIDRFVCSNTDVFSRLKIIADVYDYMIYYDADDLSVHFEPKGTVTNASVLYVGTSSNNVATVPKWSFDNEECINKLVVKGAVQEVQDDEFFDGDNTASQIFTLAKKPIVVQVWEDTTLKTPGVLDSTSGNYDYTVDKESMTITATANWTPASGTNNVEVKYTNAIPAPITVEDVGSQTSYGIREAVKFFDDIRTVEDAMNRGNGWITKYSEPFVSAELVPTALIDYDVGELIEIQDSINDETRTVLVNSIKKEFPYRGDKIVVGDKVPRLAEWGVFTLERIRRLEEKNENSADLVITVKTFDHNEANTNGYLHRKRYTDGYTKTADGAGLIWKHPTQGTWNSFPWGSDAFGAEVLVIRGQGRNNYNERFYDTDFEDTSITTADWDTASKSLIFNS